MVTTDRQYCFAFVLADFERQFTKHKETRQGQTAGPHSMNPHVRHSGSFDCVSPTSRVRGMGSPIPPSSLPHKRTMDLYMYTLYIYICSRRPLPFAKVDCWSEPESFT